MTTAARSFSPVDVATVTLVHAALVAALFAMHSGPVPLPASAPIMAELVRSTAPAQSETSQKPHSIPPLAMRTPPRRPPSQTAVQPARDTTAPVAQRAATRSSADRDPMAAPARTVTSEPDPPPPQSRAAPPVEAALPAPPAPPDTDPAPSPATAESALPTASTSAAVATSAPAQNAQPSAGTAEVTDDHRAYLAALLHRLNRFKVYPAALRKEKVEGRVVLRFTIGADGTVTGSDVQRSSGHDGLDQAAERMLVRASPLPAIPRSLHRTSLTLSVPIEYSLVTER